MLHMGILVGWGRPSIPPPASVLAAVTISTALSEANIRPPLSVGIDITVTAVTMAANIANDARYNPAINVDGGPSPAALDNDAGNGGGREHVGAGSRLVRHLKFCKIIFACIFRGSKVASEQGSSIPPIIITDAMKKVFMKNSNFASMKKIMSVFYKQLY
jgi:hypothetical protein